MGGMKHKWPFEIRIATRPIWRGNPIALVLIVAVVLSTIMSAIAYVLREWLPFF
jgi:hypothetical protein